MEWLHEKVLFHSKKQNYPFHMPGTKGFDIGLDEAYRYDITEIEGFDDLRCPNGVIDSLEKAWANMYEAKDAFLLVNGSTCGNLSSVFAATNSGGGLLVLGNYHWSIKNAAEIRELTVYEAKPDELEEYLNTHKDIEAVVITSPTYEGVVYDIKTISEVVHRYEAKLVVDSAHGAHCGIKAFCNNERSKSISDKRSKWWFFNPITQGADVVVVSLHKTLPVMGQVSLVMLPKKSRIEKERLKHYINIFQTSSPSYVLMSSASLALKRIVETNANEFYEWRDMLLDFYKDNKDLKYVNIVSNNNMELSKVIVSTKNAPFSAKELDRLLRERYLIYMEKVCEDYLIGMTSINDRKEGFERLTEALHNIS